MRARLLALLCMVGCAPVDGEDATVAARHDALPSQFGLPDSRYGASLAWCPDAGFLVGMPGSGMVMATNPAAGLPTFTTIETGAGAAVACGRNGNGGVSAFTGGDGGAFQLLADGGALRLPSSTVNGVALPVVALHYDGQSVLLGAPPYAVGGGGLTVEGTLDSGFGAAVLRIPGLVVVGAPENGTVTMFGLDGGVRHQLSGAMPGSRFGTALAWGSLSPGAGTQLLIGAPGEHRVYVVTMSNGAVLSTTTLPETGPSSAAGFGAALALEPLSLRDAGVLHALWVGAPDSNEVDRFIAGELVQQAYGETMTERFGAALAAVPGGVAVGAPGYNGGAGAIYFIESALGRNAEPQACTRGAPCPINCGVGKCVGDVLCVEPECTSTNCGCELGFSCDQPSQQCVPTPDAGPSDAGAADAGDEDAGAPDAGSPDAGVHDAGAPDAGPRDAGAPDSGVITPEPVRFTAAGCNAAPTLAFAGLALLWLLRRSARARRHS